MKGWEFTENGPPKQTAGKPWAKIGKEKKGLNYPKPV